MTFAVYAESFRQPVNFTVRSRKSLKIMTWLHLLLAIVGIYNLYGFLKYHITVWQALHSQGMTHVYLAIMNVAGCWWLILALTLCFAGNMMIREKEQESFLKISAFATLGVILSLFFPGLMQQSFFIVITWLRTLF